jgi:hypothetical protein
MVRLLKLDDKLREKIEHEILRINKLFDSGKPLLDLCKFKELDFIEASAAGSFLQSFYNGIESIILLIFKAIKEDIPNDIHWHRKLFEKAFVANEKRTAIFKNDYKEQFIEYLSFRHFFRHSYGYEIDVVRLKPLINDVEILWKLIEEDIKNYIGNN